MKTKILLALMWSMSTGITSFGQKQITILTADSLATGNYKDVFVSFFQAAAKNVSGPNKAIAFSSNPFAVMAKSNPDLLIDTNYEKYRHLRDLNLMIDAHLDSNYHINGFSLGVKYALVNARDYTVSKDFIKLAPKKNDFNKLNKLIGEKLKSKGISVELKGQIAEEFYNWANDTTVEFGSLSDSVQQIIRDIVHENNLTTVRIERKDFNFRKESHKDFLNLIDEWQKKPLWTISANGIFKPNPILTGSDNPTFNTGLFSTEFLMGLSKIKNRLRIELNVLVEDSMSRANNGAGTLARNVFSFEPGMNFVFNTKNDRSFIEFKLSGSYYNILSAPLPGEKTSNSTINGKLRIRLMDDLWVPITVKIDERGNVFGTLDVKLNFSTLRKVLSNG